MSDVIDPSAAAAAAGAAAGAVAAGQPGRTEDKKEPNWWLIAAGLLLVALFAGGVFYSRVQGSETVETTTRDTSGEVAARSTKTKTVPSDTVLTAVLATGAALVLVGALYSRIATVKLPGGTEIKLTKGEGDEIVKEVMSISKEKSLTVEDAAKVTVDALTRAPARKRLLVTGQLSESEVSKLVGEVADSL